MTVYLLILVGGIWCTIVFLVLRYVRAKIKRFRWAGVITAILGIIGLSPLMAEYWHYYSFRQYCDINAGWVLNDPVAADRLQVKGWDNYAIDALFSPRVAEASFEARKRWRDPLPIAYDGEYDPVRCRMKFIGGESVGSSIFWAADRLASEGVCLRMDPMMKTPDYVLEIVPLWDIVWPNDYRDMANTLDYRFLLLDRRDGKTLSEYRFVSTPVGPFYRHVFQWSWARYSCQETNPFDRVLHQRSRYDVVKFLDKALLSVED